MANKSFDRKAPSSLMDSVLRSTAALTSGRAFSRIMTLAGVLVVLVYWRQTGGW
ncbi:hypothetical protein [Affinirhizobium pseudoryzae]|uniref:hypothetical protein n=1 Tax=Allorhizobium pseudoryzae TaxID=379684 RepID=UPI0013ED953C|nr:hypothetical protein [Allorhizobium pseudoryzae]